ncbi:ABC transporter substrate-binding protein [Frankia sp. CNm7]|uniref:ABC transporter substrate-binding protein n=1 Tax=Frankia nepalensis TaxID=1836974 RepID=A0A937UPN0_9ACTN|nr:ABC transporter substrate-binding protein [Frankia nepalensis]MBL7498449.1 ABC transporter substrate-binding protein [Frankia nepalensis]MBL7509472.1 ABC transporter substrate-binding protein [Frankia nepalensis]MBL7522103.1 ABC transporter substrate-binding protein [Frankia nepalensis]MBL7629282.1 ABC transporter substrate-binding protein [Frankia nepalensis]
MPKTMNPTGRWVGRRPRRRAASARLGAAALAAGLLLVGCGGDDGGDDTPTAAGTSDSGLLGPVARATGAPVRIGLISDGKGPVSDLSIEFAVSDATVAYLNERHSGIAGRPIELVTCETLSDPAKGTDCANRMVEENVVAVVAGSSTVLDSMWPPMRDAKLPLMIYSASGAALRDSESTFALTNPFFNLVTFPIQMAKDVGTDKVTVISVDSPNATSVYQVVEPAIEKAGLEFDLIRIAPGTADMTPQLRPLAAGDPGIVEVAGNDAFCISAFNGLRDVGFTGTVIGLSNCISDRTQKAVPGSFLKGMHVPASAPVGTDNPSTRLFEAVATTYGKDIDTSRAAAMSMFTVLAAFQSATSQVSGDVTPQAVISAIKAAPERDLPAGGGLRFRCNGKADPTMPAVCVRGGLLTTLDDKGHPTEYKPVGVTPIED